MNDRVNQAVRSSLGTLLGRTSRGMLTMLQQSFSAAGFDITVEQWLLLVNLRNCNGQFQQHLADITYKDKATVKRLIDGLEKRGLVERVPDDIDRRQKRLVITVRGRKMLRDLKPLALKAQVKTQEGIDPGHLEICTEVLYKMHQNITGK